VQLVNYIKKIILRNIDMPFFATVPSRNSRNVPNACCFELPVLAWWSIKSQLMCVIAVAVYFKMYLYLYIFK